MGHKWTFFVTLIIICGSQASEEGAACTHDDAAGVCTTLSRCESAKQALNNSGKVTVCGVVNMKAIVCCLESQPSNDTPAKTIITSAPNVSCTLPPYPAHGSYLVANIPTASPGQQYEHFQINVICDEGYTLTDEASVLCVNGFMSKPMPECIRACKLDRHPSVDYYCLSSNGIAERLCGEYEPVGTIVEPRCKWPRDYSVAYKSNMICTNSSWSYVAICETECGIVMPDQRTSMPGLGKGVLGLMPWHANIYTKRNNEPSKVAGVDAEQLYLYLCGGTLISNTMIISAAHCFTNGDMWLPVSYYVVALGKVYKRWDRPDDVYAVKSNVKDIKWPEQFHGKNTYYKNDVALLILEHFIDYNFNIKPACMSLNNFFNDRQLHHGKMGKMPAWSLVQEEPANSQVLEVINLPYLDKDVCMDQTPADFINYITSDKFCAGYRDGPTLHKSDTGNGLVFASSELDGIVKYYLRGVASVLPMDQATNDAYTLITFTAIQQQEDFFRLHLNFTNNLL